MRNKSLLLIVLLSVFALVIAGCGTAEEAPEEGGTEAPGEGVEEGANEEGEAPADKGEIVFGVTPWSTTIPPTYVAKQILEDMGYTVRLQDAEVGIVYTGLARGDIDVFMDGWFPILHRNYLEQYEGQLETLAVSFTGADLGWVVPSYVDEVSSIEEINDHLDLFDGKVYGIDEGAGMTETSRELIEEYGLDIEYVASSEAAMLTQAKGAIDAEEPILFLGYRPHSMFAMWDLKFLEDPKGIWESSEIHVMGNTELAEKAPEAYNFFKNWSIPIDDVEQMILEIDENGADPEELAAQWIEENQELVNQMIAD